MAPDLFGYVPALFLGRPPAKGHLPPRAVWLYNLWHNFTLPVALFFALLLLFASNPWPLLGWLCTSASTGSLDSVYAAMTADRR